MNTVAAVPTLVTCHANADFDAFAAMIAARRLYPGCCLLFPGTQDRGLQAIVQDEALRKKYNFVELTDIDFAAIGRLVAVDTRQRERLSHVAPLLDREDMQVEVWDHHPDTPNDIRCTASYMEIVGSVTALLVLRLKEENIALEAEEATLLGLGIYGDTGSFTYSSTSAKDFMAAAWLLSQGMDVNRIDELAAHELTSLHVRALNALLESSQTYLISGESVVVAEVDLEHYLGDFAYLAQQVMEMEKFTVLFAIGRMDDRIQVVARSRAPSINVGAVCSSLGGGGHINAASASIRDKSLAEVHDAILNALYLQQTGENKASDYMTSPAVGMEEGRTIAEADELMFHFSLKSIPIFARGTRKCVGLIDSVTTQRAMAHGLSEEKIDDYMMKPVQTLTVDATLKDLTTVIVGSHQRLVPILDREENIVLGVVTRTDLISIFAAEPGRMDKNKKGEPKSRNMGKTLRDQLPANILHLLTLASELGRELATPVYVVGGFVRDLMLKTPNQDIDLVVEGDGLGFAAALAKRLNGRVREHKKFLTSVVLYPDEKGREQRVDVATARLEYYESPAAMPTVEHSSIKMDLYRRDFTINALAIRLDCEPMGQVVDFFGGQRDLKDRVIRVLHALSFVEDPTRILRAVRFEQRYHFRLGPATEKLVRNALAMGLLDKLSPARVFHEFEHICSEERALPAINRLQELGILQSLHPQLALNPARTRDLPKMARVLGWFRLLYLDVEIRPWFVYFLVLTSSMSYNDTLTCFRRLGLPATAKNTVMQGREYMRSLKSPLKKLFASREPRPSEVCALLAKLPLECVLYIMAVDNRSEIRRTLSRYITTWRSMTPDIGGSDLRKMGLPPGPAFAAILRRLLQAKLDHEADSPSKQYELAKRLVQEELARQEEKAATRREQDQGKAQAQAQA